MNKKLQVILAAALTVAFFATTAVAAVGATYDTAADPIVAYSGLLKWAEEVFRPSLNQTITDTVTPLQNTLDSTTKRLQTAEQTVLALEAKIEALEKELDEKADVPQTPAASTESGYSVIYLTGGTELLATSVCTIILRSGSAEVVSPFPTQGLTDITVGSELFAGNAMPTNHAVIVPRGGDGRGIRVTSSVGAYILVQGGYTVVEPQA